ncbi:hypothetical protein DICPUDRAFT_44485, partial [Dictyostelium purpureum]
SGHCSCKDCWIKSLKNKKECMQCKTKVNSFNELSRVRQIERLLLKICASCPYSFKNITRVDESEKLIKDSNGCNEIVKLEELDSHIEKCSYRFVKCKYHEKGCNDNIRFNENETHISKCEYQPLICKYCYDFYLLKTIEQHYLECPSMLIECKECNQKIKREVMSKHIDKECEELIIPCKFSQFGCNDKIKRKNLENHLDQTNHSKHFSTAIEHLITTIEYLKIKNNQLSNSIDELTKDKEILNIKNIKFSNKLKNLNIKNNQLSYRIDVLNKGRKYKNNWIISNYSKIKVGDYLMSPEFGYDPDFFKIRLFKKGLWDPNIYLHCASEQKNIKLTITLLNKDNKKNHSCSFFYGK